MAVEQAYYKLNTEDMQDFNPLRPPLSDLLEYAVDAFRLYYSSYPLRNDCLFYVQNWIRKISTGARNEMVCCHDAAATIKSSVLFSITKEDLQVVHYGNHLALWYIFAVHGHTSIKVVNITLTLLHSSQDYFLTLKMLNVSTGDLCLGFICKS